MSQKKGNSQNKTKKLKSSTAKLIKSIPVDIDSDVASDLSNEEVREIVERAGFKNYKSDKLTEDLEKRKQAAKDNQEYLDQIGERKWLAKHGKRFMIDFDEKERKEMKEYFKALDHQNKGSIGIEELQELLISVGLAESRKEVKKLIDSVDEDRSGKIEFNEFLHMIQSEGETGDGQKLVEFFKSVISGDLDKDIPQGLSFQLMISNIRRKKMVSALPIRNESPAVRKQGIKVLQAYKCMNEKRMIRKIRQEEKKRLLQQQGVRQI